LSQAVESTLGYATFPVIRVVPAGDAGAAFGIAVRESIDDPSCDVVAVVPSHMQPLPEARLATLFEPSLRIGVVVPRVGLLDGRTIEAGAIWTEEGVTSRLNVTADLSSVDTAADVDGSEHPWLAFRKDLLLQAALAPDASAEKVAEQVYAAARAATLRVVYEPSWGVQANEKKSVPVQSVRRTNSPEAQTLIVTGFLTKDSFRSDDRFVQSLIDDISDLVGARTLTVAALDGYSASAPAFDLRERGISVVSGPHDWSGWFQANWGRFDYVLVARSAMGTPVNQWLERTQPQATRVLCLDCLPSHRIQSFRFATPSSEVAGSEFFSEAMSVRLDSWLRQFHAVICERSADAIHLSPKVPTTFLPPRIERSPFDLGFQDRHGIVMMANDGADLGAANEDAAEVAIGTVVEPLRARHPDLSVSVISDRLTPRLEHQCRKWSLEMLPLRSGRQRMIEARVSLALHKFGTGGADTLCVSLATRTPFLASSLAAEGAELGALRPISVFDDPIDIRWQAEQLLFDEHRWQRHREALDAVIASNYGPEPRRDALRNMFLGFGLAAGEDMNRWPPFPAAEQEPHVIALTNPPLRPNGPSTGVVLGENPGSGPDDPTERYQLWHTLYGYESSLADLSNATTELSHRPLISVLMPVYNTDPDVLRAAINSVRDQVYEKWELCIADDGSTRPGTLELLEGIAADPQIRVLSLSENSGISVASNRALETCQGEFVAFLDHDDLLKPHAFLQVARWLDTNPSLDVIYSDEDKADLDGRLCAPHIKPDWSPDLLMSLNYVNHLTVIRRSLVMAVGGLRTGFEGSQDYDLLLRVTERTNRIAHIPEPLYTWRMVPGSTAVNEEGKLYAVTAAKNALSEALARRGTPGRVLNTAFPTFYRVQYSLPGQPRVSVIIPTRDGIDLLRPCVESVVDRSTYGNYEIVVLDNQSTDGATLEFLAKSPLKVVRYPHTFNYSRQMNLAAAVVDADALVFLNNDTKVITPDWIEALLEHAMRPDVGAVGGRLYYADGRIQHEGILIGVGSWAWNVDHRGYFERGDVIRDTSAVTGACTMMRSTVFARIGGNDERLRVAFNDVDLCLRVRQAGLRVVYTPYAELFHYEGATRKGWEYDDDGPSFGRRWRARESVDPYYSPLFERERVERSFMFSL
jgi:GT2 family glycosyltransferase